MTSLTMGKCDLIMKMSESKLMLNLVTIVTLSMELSFLMMNTHVDAEFLDNS